MAGHARWRGRRTSAIALAVLIACSASRNIAAAQGACPKEATAGKGLVMTSPDGRRGEVTWLDGGRVRIVEQ